MLLDEIRTRKIEISRIARQYGASDLRIFGSVARGQERADSDVDVLVCLPRGYDMLRQRVPLSRALADLTGRTVDLVPEHELDVRLADAIKQEAVRL